jgi:hypothetical protein
MRWTIAWFIELENSDAASLITSSAEHVVNSLCARPRIMLRAMLRLAVLGVLLAGATLFLVAMLTPDRAAAQAGSTHTPVTAQPPPEPSPPPVAEPEPSSSPDSPDAPPAPLPRRAKAARASDAPTQSPQPKPKLAPERGPSAPASSGSDERNVPAAEGGRSDGPAANGGRPPPPPPPSASGDYAGGSAALGPPQEDFDSEAQDYREPDVHEFSIRLDPLNWLLLGRLSLQLEASVWKFISVQITPTFVTASSPIALNYAGFDDRLTQHSRGLGPLSGAAVGVAAWLSGEPFYGYVIRLEFADNGYEYRAADSKGVYDKVQFTERRLNLFFGSHSRFGHFTFAGGFGLGYELHQVERCGLALVGSSSDADSHVVGRTSDCHGKQQIALSRNLDDWADLNGPLHPIYFQARFEIGVVF